ARRAHPALVSFNGMYAYIGGFDGVSSPLAAEAIGKEPLGTMPHALLIVFRGMRGSHTEGWKAFDKWMPEKVPRIALVDTFFDEVEESLAAAEKIGQEKIWGVRLDTPSTRRGDFASIISEVRWKLDSHGYENVKVFCSGGVDETSVRKLNEAGAEGFGIGGAVAAAPIIDYANDITAVKKEGTWTPLAKRSRFDGIKQVWRVKKDGKYHYKVLMKDKKPNETQAEPMLQKYIEQGELIKTPPTPDQTRDLVLRQLPNVDAVPV
ncbi:MAG: nicotinate phosphoribosyltransferase, partial [Candidatus Korarchaeota archaeon]|nr:nicotinate phosphoribosyltransferase [Candidatus Korarchaeota archaeon]NIU82745.1 nicotinate phosphoribosyltransferase [Candidatus Thorarchaeota archaeon]NIW14167.1 nicotinate phosphoribosyltransferase [Candidatus Thorarchaeota archaeon]NIW52270.1 nicotinate phosphoribosyltransferase [Candidatus Korarchaeota archaeon]